LPLPQNSLDEFRDRYGRLAQHACAKGFDLAEIIATGGGTKPSENPAPIAASEG
jgi:hypothetical protein